MARKFRVQYTGAIYHAMNRGDRREPIFLDDEDRRLFLETLGEACEKTELAGLRVGRIEAQHGLELGDRFAQSIPFCQRNPEIEVGLRIVWIQP